MSVVVIDREGLIHNPDAIKKNPHPVHGELRSLHLDERDPSDLCSICWPPRPDDANPDRAER